MSKSKSIRFVKIVSPLAVAIALAACGGDSSFGGGAKADTSTGKTSTTDTTKGGSSTTGTTQTLTKIDKMNIGLTDLSAGGSTGVTVKLRNQKGDLFTEDATVEFSSKCTSEGTSEIKPSLSSKTGVFTVTYTAKGCEGEDKITARVGSLETSGIVNVKAAELGAVEFVSAEPQNLILKGMSAPKMQHTSVVKFQIKNNVGGPIPNTEVDFELVTTGVGSGGVSLSTTKGKTDQNGFVSTIVESGTIHTSVRVRATVKKGDKQIQSESSQLVISTGIADQNSLSLSFSTLNPAAWEYDGVEVGVNIIASDRYNNPVPDGTTVSFYTELGTIEDSCQTTNGRCSVKWTSSSPKNLGIQDARYPRQKNTTCEGIKCSDGITTITAKVIGEESFIDSNANGIFDDGDLFDTLSDKGEAFADYNKGYNASNGDVEGYDDGLDRFILDYNGDGIRNPKDGKYTGLGCKHPTLCDSSGNGLKDIFVSGEIVLAEDNQVMKVTDVLTGEVMLDTSTSNLYKALLLNHRYRLEVFGVQNHQVPPEGTTTAITADGATVKGGKLEIASTSAHNKDVTDPYGAASVEFFFTKPEKMSGTVDINVKTPGINNTVTIGFDTDTDNDGTGNFLDDDDDGDGVLDTVELANGTDPLDPSSK